MNTSNVDYKINYWSGDDFNDLDKIREEDRYFINDNMTIKIKNRKTNIGCFFVFDGHTSNVVSQFLADNFENILQETSNSFIFNSLSDLIESTIKKIHNELKFKINENLSGSTMSGVILDYTNKKFITVNLGDSKTGFNLGYSNFTEYQTSKNSVKFEYSKDCKIDPLENRICHPKYGCSHTLGLSGSFGDLSFANCISKDAEIKESSEYNENFEDNSGKMFTFVIATDGFWDVLDNIEGKYDLMKDFVDRHKANLLKKPLSEHDKEFVELYDFERYYSELQNVLLYPDANYQVNSIQEFFGVFSRFHYLAKEIPYVWDNTTVITVSVQF